jgi:hypothetical protein
LSLIKQQRPLRRKQQGRGDLQDDGNEMRIPITKLNPILYISRPNSRRPRTYEPVRMNHEDQSSRSIEILQSEVKKCNLGR